MSHGNRSGLFPSPGSTPSYRNAGAGGGYANKGWSSERVPLPAHSARRYGTGSSMAFFPFGGSNAGKAIPSKWEDAEKWICSPVSSADGSAVKTSALPPHPHHRRPKSKSGPLATNLGAGIPSSSSASYYSASPLMPTRYFDGADAKFRNSNAITNAAFMAGVLVPDRGSAGSATSSTTSSNARGEISGSCGGRSCSAQSDQCILRSTTVNGWSELLMMTESSSPLQSSDERQDSKNSVAAKDSPIILRKDMATQMSPEGSVESSLEEKPESSSLPSHATEELQNHLAKLEVRDVQVDDRVTVMRWSKKHIARGLDKSSENVRQFKKKIVESRSTNWEIAETARCASKLKREEAKINAWENLQKAKAEAAIRKLEMKLEKKRSSSMDKILKKLRSAQRRAEEMREVVAANEGQQGEETSSRKTLSFARKGQMGSLSGCFTCHAF